MADNKPRFFDVLSEMQKQDEEHSTRNLALSNNLTQAQRSKRGGLITMGVDTVAFNQISNSMVGANDKIVILMIVDRTAMQKTEKELEARVANKS